jgi:hypothetical protein
MMRVARTWPALSLGEDVLDRGRDQDVDVRGEHLVRIDLLGGVRVLLEPRPEGAAGACVNA